MGIIVCKNEHCKFKGVSGYCTNEFINLNQYGGCAKWWTPDGQFRGQMYEQKFDEVKPEDASK